MKPELSEHFKQRNPSVIRAAQIEFLNRKQQVEAINVAIGNVSLPMHPAMIRRLANLQAEGSPFRGGAVRYTPTAGMEETRQAVLHIIASSGFETAGLHAQITDGGSQAIELAILGVCGQAGVREKPLLIIDPTYTNYTGLAARLGRSVLSLRRSLQPDGRFTLPAIEQIEELIVGHRPGGLLVIPYDNPTGQLYTRAQMMELAGLCVKHNMWMISDEAYRELMYGEAGLVSIWGITDGEVPGIQGRRISVETASKVWNACGLRIGALVTDSEDFHRRAVSESTATLCPNAIGQYVFAALGQESHADLRRWYARQREYYRVLMNRFAAGMARALPGAIVSAPDAAIYSVVDVREIAAADFEAMDFVLYCAKEGEVILEGKRYTLLVAPMSGFYNLPGAENPGRTQMRVAFVASPQEMEIVPRLFAELFHSFQARAAKPKQRAGFAL